MTDPGPEKVLIEFRCASCGLPGLSPPIDVLGATPDERFNAVSTMMADSGWTVTVPNEEGEKGRLCPRCSAIANAPPDQPAETVLLDIYRPLGPCPKCKHTGKAKIETVYRHPDAHAKPYRGEPPCEHLLRICTRCGYRWPQACVDAKPKGKRRGRQDDASTTVQVPPMRQAGGRSPDDQGREDLPLWDQHRQERQGDEDRGEVRPQAQPGDGAVGGAP